MTWSRTTTWVTPPAWLVSGAALASEQATQVGREPAAHADDTHADSCCVESCAGEGLCLLHLYTSSDRRPNKTDRQKTGVLVTVKGKVRTKHELPVRAVLKEGLQHSCQNCN